MILLDTHIWVWWASQDASLSPRHQQVIQTHQADDLGVSNISCWEVAKLVEVGRLQLTIPVADWLTRAVALPGIRLFELTIPIIVASTQLPGDFHRDPADQLIVATARIHDIPLLTVDSRILQYPHVKLL